MVTCWREYHTSARVACPVQYRVRAKEGMLNFTDNDYRVKVPVKLKRCGIETKLIIADYDSPQAHHRTVQAIQQAMAKALNWNQALISGKAVSKAALARTEGISQRYVTQIIKLAYLAPDIIDSIIKGNIPATLSLVRLKEDIPLDWNEQRSLFGFQLNNESAKSPI